MRIGRNPLNMARKSKSMAANNQTAGSPHLIPDLNEIHRTVVRGCDETAASLQASSLRSLWRMFRHGDGVTEYLAPSAVQSALMPANLTTLPHFSVSLAISRP